MFNYEKKWIILTKNYPVNDGHLVYEYDGILRIYIQDKNKNKIELKGKDMTLAKLIEIRNEALRLCPNKMARLAYIM